MPAIERTAKLSAWRRLGNRLSTRLIAALLAAFIPAFAVLTTVNLRLHRANLEAEAQTAADRASDVIKRSTSYYMLHNDREGLYQMIRTVGAEPGIERVRIFNEEGRISFSSHPEEIGHYVEKDNEACYGCHQKGQPLVRLSRPDRYRVYKKDGARVLGIINPIENQPACSGAPCHAHPPSQKILGVLDTNLSLAAADQRNEANTRFMAAYSTAAGLVISAFIGLMVWWLLERPLRSLKAGTVRLAQGDLGYQILIHSRDEVGEVAASFNHMSRELATAREELTAAARDLELRVDVKTRELRAAHQQMLMSERLASIGKLAAIVAHEINNPLSGILTYAKLVQKWLSNGKPDAEHSKEIASSLELIESEARRCGEIVRNMLTFARATPMNLAWHDLNQVMDRVVRLVRHKLQLAGIDLQTAFQPILPPTYCDGAQIEQLLLALTMNAIEAMPHGGVLRLGTGAEDGRVRLVVEDNGTGIAPEVQARLFEPFTTTKEKSGVGLGLAVSRQIVDRHNGVIEVESQPGTGTTITVTLPLGREAPPEVALEPATKAGQHV